MGDYRSERVDRHRDEGLYTDQIEKDRKEREEFSEQESEETKILFATFFNQLKTFFGLISPSKKFAGKAIDKQEAVDHLREFKRLLKALGTTNLSNSSEYATDLSDAWCKLIDDFDNIEIIERKTLSEVSQFRETMDTIKNYPLESEHRLGYYLLEHAGKDWLPFPFIEILEALHTEHQSNTKKSTLTKWVSLIDQTIEKLTPNLLFRNAPPS